MWHQGSELNYYVDFPISGSSFTWYITGGTITADNGYNVNVIWDATGPYQLTVWMNDCETTIYLQDCECDVPEGFTEIIDLQDINYWNGTGPDLYAIAAILDPAGGNSWVLPASGTQDEHIEVSGLKLFFRGVFNMTTAQILFKDCDIMMDRGSVIYPPTLVQGFGQEYYNCFIHGACDYMWQGIRLRRECHFTMSESDFQDAEYGIQINTKVEELNLVHNHFYMNYVMLYAPPNSQGNLIYGNIEENDWDGSMSLVSGHYNGQSWVGQWAPNGLSPLPQNDQSFAAIEIWDLFQSTIYGIPWNTSSGPNYFHDFNLGVWNRDSYVDIYNCSFENILDNGSYGLYGNFNGSAVYAIADPGLSYTPTVHIGNDPTLGNPYPNLFVNTIRDIFLEQNLDSWIDGNSEYLSIRTIEIANSDGHIHMITHNFIDQTYYGIFSNVNTNSIINIHSNSIATINNGMQYLRDIEILDGTSNTCTADVFDNIITSFSTTGIWGFQNQGSTYRNNLVFMNSSGLASGVLHLYGILLQNGNNNTVTCNNVFGNTGPSNVWLNRRLRCYIFGNETNLTVLCNSAHHGYAGFEYYGTNTGPFAGNSMSTLYDGLVLGDYVMAAAGSTMSNQTLYSGQLPGNTYSTFNHAATHAISSTGATLWYGGGIPFFPTPNLHTGPGGAAFNALGVLGYTTYECLACTAPGGSGHDGREHGMVVDNRNGGDALKELVNENAYQPKDNKSTSISDKEFEDLFALANSCPAGNERRVFAARSKVINSSKGIGIFFDDMILCSEKRAQDVNDNINSVISATLYPNPASNTISIIMNEVNFATGELQIFNLVGEKVMSVNVVAVNQLKDIDLSMLSNGFYVCHYVSESSDLNLGKLSIIK